MDIQPLGRPSTFHFHSIYQDLAYLFDYFKSFYSQPLGGLVVPLGVGLTEL